MDALDNNDDDSFEGVLDSIRTDAQRVLEGSEALDPDGIIERFGNDTVSLANLIAREQAAAEEQAEEKAVESRDFHAVVECSIRRLVVSSGSPVLLRTNLAENLPHVAADGKAAAQLCERTMLVAIAHAGDGGYVSICTRLEDDCVIFELTAEPGFEGSDEAAKVPNADLESLAEKADGEFSIGVDTQGMLHIAVTLLSARVH